MKKPLAHPYLQSLLRLLALLVCAFVALQLFFVLRIACMLRLCLLYTSPSPRD